MNSFKIALVLLMITGCSNRKNSSGAEFVIQNELVQFHDSIQDIETRKLELAQVVKVGNIDSIIKTIRMDLNRAGFKGFFTIKNSPINERILRADGSLKSVDKSRFTNSNSKSVSLLIYEYYDFEHSTTVFNNLASSEFREGIFKSGGIVSHFDKYIICIIGSCSIERNEWQNIINLIHINLPRFSCYCGGYCDEQF